MNIFATSDDPVACAEALDDKRVVKMVLETAQLLCTVLSHRGIVTPYKPTHETNKLVRWASEEPHTYWLLRHGFALDAEYTHRFDNKRHQSGEVIDSIRQHIVRTKEEPEFFINAARHGSLGLDFTMHPVHAAYRRYLNARWPTDKRRAVWTRRVPPRWATWWNES